MSRKVAKAHWTIYTIILNGIEDFPHPSVANSTIVELLIEKEVSGK
jgi:hypothetical protein